jgi:polar amino acid transport system substrate-binding protein
VIKAALAELRQPYLCDTTSWRRAQRMVEQGQRDGMITLLTEERQRYSVHGHEAVISVAVHAFTRHDHPLINELSRFTRLDQFKGFTTVTYHGDGFAQTQLAPLGIRLDYADNMEQVLRKLFLHHGDVTLQSALHTQRDIYRFGLQHKIVQLQPALFTSNYYLMLNKHSPFVPLIPQLDKELLRLRRSGRLQQLLQQWTHSP